MRKYLTFLLLTACSGQALADDTTVPSTTIASINGPATVGAAPVPLPPPGPLCDPSWEVCGIPVPPPPTTTIAPATAVRGRCTQYEPLLTELAPKGGWDVVKMSKYMWRESRCLPAVRSRTRDTGLLQINDVNLSHLRTVTGQWVDRYTLTDPAQNIAAAARLCEFWRANRRSCYRPWGGRG